MKTLISVTSKAVMDTFFTAENIALAESFGEVVFAFGGKEEVKRLSRRKKAEEKAAEAEAAAEDAVFEVDYAEVLADRLMRELGRRVTITAGKRKKTITFCYEDNEDLDRFLRRLCGDAFMDAE